MSNIYAFHGADSKVGVTMTAQSAAQCLSARYPRSNVLFLVLAGKQNSEYLRGKDTPIEKFKSRLDSGLPIRKSDLRPSETYSNLYVISGLTQELDERYYTPETAERLLTDMHSQFDVIIIDSGSRPDSGLVVGGLMCATKKYLVLAQSEAAMCRYERNSEIYRNMGLRFDRFIVNKYAEKDPYTVGYISKRLGVNKDMIATVVLSEIARRAEREYKTLFEYSNGRYAGDIRGIAGEIAAETGLESVCKEERQNGKVLFGRLFKANAATGAER